MLDTHLHRVTGYHRHMCIKVRFFSIGRHAYLRLIVTSAQELVRIHLFSSFYAIAERTTKFDRALVHRD